MVRKISNKTKKLIRKLYSDDLSIAEIMERANVSRSTIYNYTVLMQVINPETRKPFKSRTEYEKYRARQRINLETRKPFKSRTEYENHLASQKINPETGKKFKSKAERQDYQARQMVNPETRKLFKSLSEYEKYQARQRINPETGKPFKSKTEYKEYRARQRINPETGKPFKSASDQKKYQAKQKPVNKKLGSLIQQRLIELGRTQEWLAKQLGITQTNISKYVCGGIVPRESLQGKLFRALKLPHKTLDDLLE